LSLSEPEPPCGYHPPVLVQVPPQAEAGERHMLKAGYKGEDGKFVPPHIAVVSAEEFSSKTPYASAFPSRSLGRSWSSPISRPRSADG
jgi:hypothetical protein